MSALNKLIQKDVKIPSPPNIAMRLLQAVKSDDSTYKELGKLNLSYEQLLIEYKEAKQRAERLAADLKEANDKLRELSVKDGLTGLYNHRHFRSCLT